MVDTAVDKLSATQFTSIHVQRLLSFQDVASGTVLSYHQLSDDDEETVSALRRAPPSPAPSGRGDGRGDRSSGGRADRGARGSQRDGQRAEAARGTQRSRRGGASSASDSDF